MAQPIKARELKIELGKIKEQVKICDQIRGQFYVDCQHIIYNHQTDENIHHIQTIVDRADFIRWRLTEIKNALWEIERLTEDIENEYLDIKEE